MRILTAPTAAAVALAAVLGTSAIGVAQETGPRSSPAAGSGVDRSSLEQLCQENAPDTDELSVCLDVVRSYLTPESEPSSNLSMPSDKVTVKGTGQKTTKAFELAGGDYLVSFRTKHPNPKDSYGFSCVIWAYLKSADDRSSVGEIKSGARGRKWNKADSYIYAVPEGRYYWDFSISNCDWEVTAKSTSIDYEEPLPGVVVRSGTGAMNTEAFALTGGDYLVSWSLKAGKDSCSPSGRLKDKDGDFFGVGSFDASAKKGKKSSGETRFYAVDSGHYYWEVSGFTEPDCKWTVTITAEA